MYLLQDFGLTHCTEEKEYDRMLDILLFYIKMTKAFSIFWQKNKREAVAVMAFCQITMVSFLLYF